MCRLEEIKSVLGQMASFLSDSHFTDWSSVLVRLKNYIDENPAEAMYQIRRLYGGMGSLSDIVLQKGGESLHKENDAFNQLRDHLYSLCSARLE